MIDRACISLSNLCNLKCKYCHFQDKQNDYTSFDIKELIEIIENIHIYCLANKLKSFKLGIVGSGEPMINKKEILELLEYIKNNDYTEFKMYTINNGTLLTKDDLIKFHEYKDYIQLCFSLDGYKEIHNAGRDKFDKVMNTIDIYKNIYKESPNINATVNLLSYKNKEKTVNFFKENNLLKVTFSKLVGYSEADLYITDKQYNEFMEFVKKSGLESRQFRKEKKYDCTMYGQLCGVGRTNIFITKEGIYPCGRFYKNDKYLLGNYNDSLIKVERKVKQLTPVKDGKCYYVEHVEGK